MTKDTMFLLKILIHLCMIDHTLHCGKTHFCCYHLQAFTDEEIIKCHVKDCFKINGKQMIKMP